MLSATSENETAPEKGRAGNPKWVRGPYYERLERCLLSQAKVLEMNGENLRVWFDGKSRREFREEVEDALRGFKLPSDRVLREMGKTIVTKIEKRGLLGRKHSNSA